MKGKGKKKRYTHLNAQFQRTARSDKKKRKKEIKWALGIITMNKASGGDGIPAKLFQILRDDTIKMLYSFCQQIWKTQQ